MPAQYIETRQVPIRDLTHFPGNAKRGDVAAIQESLRRNGQYRSLIARKTPDGDLIVLAGNHTMRALAANGNKTARCEIITCDDAEARKINLADNRLAELGEWDDEALAELLQATQDDLDGTGYSFDDLDDLLAAADATEVMPEGPTGARYAESEEELDARRAAMDAYKPRYAADDSTGEEPPEATTAPAQPDPRPAADGPHPAPSTTGGTGAITELILVLTVEEKTEAADLISRIRQRDGDLTAGQITLAALRVHAPE